MLKHSQQKRSTDPEKTGCLYVTMVIRADIFKNKKKKLKVFLLGYRRNMEEHNAASNELKLSLPSDFFQVHAVDSAAGAQTPERGKWLHAGRREIRGAGSGGAFDLQSQRAAPPGHFLPKQEAETA